MTQNVAVWATKRHADIRHMELSAWEHFNGPFNFDATPLGPPGCKIIGHARGSTRLSWDYRGHMGFYVGPALDHYRCHKILKTSTSAVIISDTVVFQHPTLSVPTLTTTDRIIHCLRALTNAVRADKTPDNCNAQLLAVESLRAIFDLKFNTPPTPNTTLAPQPTTQIAPNQIARQRVQTQIAHQATLPRVGVTQPTAPRVGASLPRVGVAPPRVATLQNPPTDMQLIAHRTRLNRANADSIAASAHAALGSHSPSQPITSISQLSAETHNIISRRSGRPSLLNAELSPRFNHHDTA